MSENIGKIIVLDIKTAPDPYLLSFAPSRMSKDHPSLHAVTGYSILAAEEDQNGDWSVTDLASPQNTDEYEMLFELDEMVTPAIEQGATLVTYNGISHDVLMIQRRMGAHMLYALPSQSGLARMKHRDMMREVSTGPSNWPSLQQLCAIYSIPFNHLLIPSRGPIAPTHERKSQVDVIATYLTGMASTAIWSFGGQLVSRTLDWGPTGTAVLWSCIGAGGIAGAWAGNLVSRFGLGRVNMLSCGVMAVTVIAVGSDVELAGLILGGGALFGAAYVMLTGVYLVWGVRALPDRPATGLTIGFLTLAIGQTVGAPLFGLLMGGPGVQTAIVVFAALALLAGIIRTGLAPGQVGAPSHY